MGEIGEQVMGKLALNKPSDGKKHKHNSKRKFATRSIVPTWLGVHPRTGEHIIEAADGTAIHVRIVNRVEAGSHCRSPIAAAEAHPSECQT